ncbi:MAG TPA: hypothetical protein VEU33_33460 [Archangium sp.]|nr:hypothetical protein [Archangium sp.]
MSGRSTLPFPMPPATPEPRLLDPARHAPGLDTLRVLAIALVLGFHYPGFAALVVLAMTEAGARVLGRLPGARWLAGVTYCVYLSHKLVIHAVHGVLAEHGMGAHHPVTLLASAACVLAVAALLHLGVERPFLRLRERWGRPPVRQALAATV